MGSPLDGITEKHDGPEPRVLTQDVRIVLLEVVRPEAEGGGDSVTLVAEKSAVSTRTVYRVLQRPEDEAYMVDGIEYDTKTRKPRSISLDLGDRLCLAAGSHLAHCRLVWPSGAITPYF